MESEEQWGQPDEEAGKHTRGKYPTLRAPYLVSLYLGDCGRGILGKRASHRAVRRGQELL